jgi:20S proteasome alpha/beta subunit
VTEEGLQEPEDLFETISQTLLNAVDRDAYSGWGAVVHVVSVISFCLSRAWADEGVAVPRRR